MSKRPLPARLGNQLLADWNRQRDDAAELVTTGRQMRKFFITGVQKSGTTLLRSILHAHPDVAVAYECAFYKRLADNYGDGVSTGPELDSFLDALFSVRRFEHWELDRETIASKLRSQGDHIPYSSAIDAIARLYVDTHAPKAKIFGFKNPHGIYHINFIHSLFQDAKVINVIRDPRGVLGSLKRKELKRGIYDPDRAPLRVWRWWSQMHQCHNSAVGDPRYLAIRYEDLIHAFEPTIQTVLDFLEINMCREVLEYHRINSGASIIPQSDMYQHSLSLKAPVKSRTDAWKKELTFSEISTIEVFCLRDLKSINAVRYGSLKSGTYGVARSIVRRLISKLKYRIGQRKPNKI